MLDNLWQRIEYEGLPQNRFECWRVGDESIVYLLKIGATSAIYHIVIVECATDNFKDDQFRPRTIFQCNSKKDRSIPQNCAWNSKLIVPNIVGSRFSILNNLEKVTEKVALMNSTIKDKVDI